MKTIAWFIIVMQIGMFYSFAGNKVTQTVSLRKDKETIEKFGEKATAVLAGKVTWAEHEMRRITVQVYADEDLKDLYCSGIVASEDGSYEINVEPGKYYVVAFVDGNRNGRFDLGDGMGVHGITDWEDRSQKRKLVRVAENETRSGIDIEVSATIVDIDGHNQIVPADSDYVKKSDRFRLELDKMFTGVSGKLVWPEHELKNALIFAYADLTWKYRVATSECDKNGNFELNLLPGKYYFLAVIDENQNNLFDEGDKFGIYGMTELGSGEVKYPQPILLEKNEFASKIKIQISGMQDTSGNIVSLSDQKIVEEAGTRKKTDLSGKIIWEVQDLDLKNAVVFAYKDPTLMTTIGHAKCDADGNFKLQLPPGKYFLIANVDINGDGKYSAGDGIGGYGTDDITRKHPAEFVLSDDGTSGSKVEISITAKYDKNGQLVAIGSGASSEMEKIISSGISGKIIWDGGQNFTSALLAVSETPEFSSAVFVPIEIERVEPSASPTEVDGPVENAGSLVFSTEADRPDNADSLNEKDGSYILPLKPGDYYIMAIVDTNGDNIASVKDGVGIYSTRSLTQNLPQQLSVFEKRITPYIDIEISGVYIDDQNIAQIDNAHRPDIRKQYGEPEDIFRFSKFGVQIEEWWYWTQGVMFAFESAGVGWKLDNREEFEPRSEPPESQEAGKQENEKTGGSFQSSAKRDVGTTVGDLAIPSERLDHIKRDDGIRPLPGTAVGDLAIPSERLDHTKRDDGIRPLPGTTVGDLAIPSERLDPESPMRPAITNLPEALIYYTYDDIVWGVAPNGIHQPLGAGKYPTISKNSAILSLMDTDGNIHLIELENKQDDVFLKRSEMASAPSISPDGKYLAFVRKTIDRSQIFIKHISTGEESPLPSTSVLTDTPAWNSDGSVIVYAASGNIENSNSEENWNIYSYDIETQRLDPISVTDEDEYEPAWSPTEHNVLVFSRSENNHRQIWLITIDQDGNPTERQLTDFGGQDPAWLPDGRSIIYENNGQLWFVDVEGQNERPFLIDSKPVFGLDPFAGGIDGL